jgi:hypothetical protein
VLGFADFQVQPEQVVHTHAICCPIRQKGLPIFDVIAQGRKTR